MKGFLATTPSRVTHQCCILLVNIIIYVKPNVTLPVMRNYETLLLITIILICELFKIHKLMTMATEIFLAMQLFLRKLQGLFL